MKNLILILCLLPLLGCVKTVDIEPAALNSPPGAEKVPGKYAVVILGGQWTLPAIQNIGAPFDIGAGGAYRVSADPAYEETVKRSLAGALGSVTFFPAAPAYQKLAQDGYDAEIVIRQGPATVQFHVLGFGAYSQVMAAVQTIVIYDNGKSDRRSFVGGGAARVDSLWLGDAVSDALNDAFQKALREAMQDAISALRSELRPSAGVHLN